MTHLRLTLEYMGTRYHGWQIQSLRPIRTVQSEVERALKRLFRDRIKVQGAGRTDSGVHALGQVVSFCVPASRMPPSENLDRVLRSVNAFLPWDIRAKDISEVSGDFHARFSARSKLYRYLIYTARSMSPFLKDRAWHVLRSIDWKKAVRCAKLLEGRHDFRYLSGTGSPRREYICRLYRIRVRRDGELFSIDMEADRFLYKMARYIVTLMVDVGTGRIRPDEVRTFFRSRYRPPLLAPACGLYMVKVRY